MPPADSLSLPSPREHVELWEFRLSDQEGEEAGSIPVVLLEPSVCCGGVEAGIAPASAKQTRVDRAVVVHATKGHAVQGS